MPEPVAVVWQRIRDAEGHAEPLASHRRVVIVLTTNERKLPEYRTHLDRYDVEVHRIDPVEDRAWLAELLACSTEGVRILALIREESDLYQYRTTQRSTFQHLERVENVATLTVHKLVDGALESTTYRHATEGYIDATRRRAGEPTVFGWDDVFVVKNTGRTYHELREQGLKVSSRDMVLSEFLYQHIYYRPGINLKFSPREQRRPIDFRNAVGDFVAGNAFLNNPVARRRRLTNVWERVVAEGVFFRAPENRREKNYWLPGLNAGIPFVPKKDAVHEITYMAHDFGHFLLPDLIFTGEADDHRRRVYIIARMMSEAVTLVLADMLFVDTLRTSGIEYDWSKRRIYPLFANLGLDLEAGPHFLTQLERLLRANVRYCLRGDDGGYRALLTAAGKGTESLESFTGKYMPFFVEDYRWTARNWANLAAHADFFHCWWPAVEPLRTRADLALETIDEFAAHLDRYDGDLVDQVFARLFRTRIVPVFEADHLPSTPREVQLGRAFFRYLLGQLGLMVAFDFVPESAVYLDKLRAALLATGPHLDGDTIDRLRGFYEQYVDLLLEKNLLSTDDARTYREVYPLFPPVFVHYDEQEGFYADLTEVSRRILGGIPCATSSST
jgi:adenylate kinase